MAAHWYENSRGEWYVISQFALFALVAFGPRNISRLPEWSPFMDKFGLITGCCLMGAGGLLALAGMLKLGRNLTPFVCPKAGSIMLERGAYRIVRHPVYSGLVQLAFGWALLVHGWLTLGYAVLLFLLLDAKTRREEKWLIQHFPGYAAYRRRVRRLIPFVY